ncbi:50S ribosomal protein L11 [Candidatus Woesearchaeota archaeon]|jgi:large subunit ribosomal protein L11|nr:50S ribosomal protein L11 [Candidatus Woesearchaeota archaeon]MBT3438550.1 50S ribosomal protein L11 [Candidatus Woesearchaeota archaeon]MBT4058327.1 50S ribosomal protein L11 [Candidatus Woesearchaeota archaeon]MBT4208051.1 50S ribosomal protein L11 [Candidatus Woesearchaeota archaeon]MBT4732031.1 50S ribosomal protein L11 [Candidatus Woesearchaeota archaeon]
MIKIKLMIEGGKASTTPAMAQTLGPLKMDMQGILKDVNEKTMTYKGLKVPVELDVDEKAKTYTITVKSPPASELIKNEIGIKTGSGEPEKKKVGNISVEQLIKVAKMKMESLFSVDLRASMRAVAGTCNSVGVLIEGNISSKFNELLAEGKYNSIIDSDNPEASAEKLKELKTQLEEVQAGLDKTFAKKQGKAEKEKEAKPEEVKEESAEEKKKEDESK